MRQQATRRAGLSSMMYVVDRYLLHQSSDCFDIFMNMSSIINQARGAGGGGGVVGGEGPSFLCVQDQIAGGRQSCRRRRRHVSQLQLLFLFEDFTTQHILHWRVQTVLGSRAHADTSTGAFHAPSGFINREMNAVGRR